MISCEALMTYFYGRGVAKLDNWYPEEQLQKGIRPLNNFNLNVCTELRIQEIRLMTPYRKRLGYHTRRKFHHL